MCDQRERLIEYLYEEAAPDERRRVETHLEACGECRAEMRAFRRVREDLLAWEVPETSSVWTPFAPVAAVPWHRQVPAWAMAAAAGLMFVLGTAGGFVAQAAFTRPAPVASAAVTPAPAVPPPALDPSASSARAATPVSLSNDEVLALVRGELTRLQRVSATAHEGDAEALVAKAAEQQWARVYEYLRLSAEERMLERKGYDERISRLAMQLDGVQQAVAVLVQQQTAKGQQ